MGVRVEASQTDRRRNYLISGRRASNFIEPAQIRQRGLSACLGLVFNSDQPTRDCFVALPTHTSMSPGIEKKH